ncbi:MAG: hypothetical protein A2W86_02615 [Bacteroidetes bacterium GWD2_45_23]|nr:MAG: hypothetical protein A2W87_00365 [Bacteroidetes bacterium GWC2_46_850]OFX69209.1 MAG: hypothetical protein A2071_09800 [Bacteroidetes bacterium GWC1_47_7]OFX87306.1 MAG: hypothetical protein A2W86_02615 [Bacteroidetes bacterium GWD2_45_23]HAR37364.1 hypothetical protein [Porphyromonadaceae bacterium]HBB01666.1 hypothetical protein [Porphyromonadaceae bacterium]
MKTSMKKMNNILLWMVGLVFLSSCAEEELGPVINPAAENGSLTYVLNQTRYSGFTYVLEQENDGTNMDALVTTQPDYGFKAAVTYYVQVSFDENMSTFIELPSSVQGENVAINTKEMNKALFDLYQGEMPNPSVSKDIYLRLKAIVSNATKNALTTEPTVKPLLSNVIKLNVLPYYIENLKTYKEATILSPYYIIGYMGWDNSTGGLGSNVIPLSVVEGSVYNAEGKGIYSYTGYFEASKTFKLIGVVGGWSEQWGNKDADGIDNPVHNDGGSSNFKVPESGYYIVTLNSITNQVSITKTAITPKLFNNMGVVGAMTDWGGNPDISMTAYQTVNNHMWYAEYTFTADSECKFRYNSDWGDNWGDATFPYGIATAGGKNIPVKAGTYMVFFNDIDKTYTFIKK